MRALYIAAAIIAPSFALAEEITLRDLHEGGVLTIQTEELPCPDWASDFGNLGSQEAETYQGLKKFYWVRNWGNENDWRLYQSLNGHIIVIKKDFETAECMMQIFGPVL